MWDEAEREQVIKMLAIVCEVTGTDLSQPAKKLILAKLEGYRAPGVLRALDMAATTCKYRLTLADICEHLSHAPLPPAAEVLALSAGPVNPQLEANKKRLAGVLARIAGEVPAPTGGPAHWTKEKERES